MEKKLSLHGIYLPTKLSILFFFQLPLLKQEAIEMGSYFWLKIVNISIKVLIQNTMKKPYKTLVLQGLSFWCRILLDLYTEASVINKQIKEVCSKELTPFR
jgi:hypothetical protein